MIIHVMSILCFMLLIPVGILFLLKPVLTQLRRYRQSMTGSEVSLSLAGQVILDRTRRLSFVRCGEREILVLTGGANDVLLDWMSGQDFASLVAEKT